MIDRTFFATLTFAILAAGTLAIGSDFVGPGRSVTASSPPAVVQLPTVHVVGRRATANVAVASTAGSVRVAAHAE